MLVAMSTSAYSQLVGHEECGTMANHIGPWDYRTKPEVLGTVERHHFAPQVEQLKAGQSSYLMDDLDYVLLAFPNHHRALNSLTRLAQKSKGPRITNARHPTYCYYLRAIEIAPDDARVRGIYAIYLSNNGKVEEALVQSLEGERLGADDGNSLYNIGLLYYKSKDYEMAREYAKRAEAAGYPLSGLKDLLRKAGAWKD
jgi:tetratricopeptide (TPR) repeat protein